MSLVSLSGTITAEEAKRIAILETVDREGNVPYGVKLQVRSSLTFAVSHTQGYEGYDRVDVSSILGEHSFQRTGMVSNTQIKKLGEMSGAQYVLIAEAALYDEQNVIITAKILDVETGGISKSAPPFIANKAPEKMEEACIQLALTMLKGVKPSRKISPKQDGPSQGIHDFTETAWGINMKMIWVEGGDFLMGCTGEQENCYNDEAVVRRVTLDGFYIGTFEVTQSQWEQVMGTSISQQRDKTSLSWAMYGDSANSPMYYVNWNEAMEFCRRLSIKTGRHYGLPSEAQWEYAARGGQKSDKTQFSGSNSSNLVAWDNSNSKSTSHPCGQKQPNELGIYDMSGNVQEWCSDNYVSTYDVNNINNPLVSTEGSFHVIRGGSWTQTSRECRVSCRHHEMSSFSYYNLGFRVVLMP